MKKRLTAMILLLALVLSACTLTVPTAPTEAPTEETARPKPTETEAPTEAPETTEAPTEAPTEATEEPAQALDVGTVDGSTYRNEALGIACDFPEGWYIYNDTDLAALNNYASQQYDNAAITNAIESGQVAVVFCASQPGTYSSLNITAEKNQAPGFSEEAIINYSIPSLKAQLAQTGMNNIVCDTVEREFCGQKHTAIEVTCDVADIQFYETLFILTCGDYFYTVTAASAQKAVIADMLNFFVPIG